MSRITKEIAKVVSVKLTEKKREEVKKLQNQLRDKISSIYESQLPKEVISLYKKMPNYFNTTTSTRIQSAGFSYEYYQINELPRLSTNFIVSDLDAKFILDLKNKISELKNKLNKLSTDIENTLFNLRTYKNVENNFKEAFVLLPKENKCTALSVNISDLISQLKETV